jgi:hypothetical protein
MHPEPDSAFRIRIRGFDEQKLGKNTAEIFLLLQFYP